MLRCCLFVCLWVVLINEGFAGWKAAAARAVITPSQPMMMAGYASRTTPSEGIALDLCAKTLVLEDERQQRLVVLTLDLIGVPKTMRARIAAECEQRWKIPSANVLINASHTHCGPELRADRPGKTPDDSHSRDAIEYTASLEQTLLRDIEGCLQRLEPATLGYSHARCGFAMNRRLPVEGDYRNSPYPDGPVDHDVPVLRVANDKKELLAVLFGYACHNTTLSFNQFCGDYAGFAQQQLEAAHPGMIALFLTGCGGDQNPYPRGTLELCQQHGQSLATAVEAALLPEPRPIEGPLSTALVTQTLHFAPLPSNEVLTERAASKNKYVAGHAARLLKRLEANEAIDMTYSYPIQVIRFGNALTLVTLGGEVVVDYSLRLKREFTETPLWVAGYSNDVFGYVPSERVLKEGGYEGGGAMVYTSFPGPFASGTEELIITATRNLLDRTKP